MNFLVVQADLNRQLAANKKSYLSYDNVESRLILVIHRQNSLRCGILDNPVSRPSALFLIFFMNLRLTGISSSSEKESWMLSLSSDSVWL